MEHPLPAAAALLLAAMAAWAAIAWAPGETRPPGDAFLPLQASQPPAPRNAEPATFVRCRENVAIIHDVHWAAACEQQPDDKFPDCELPPEIARVLNAARERDEQSCTLAAGAVR